MIGLLPDEVNGRGLERGENGLAFLKREVFHRGGGHISDKRKATIETDFIKQSQRDYSDDFPRKGIPGADALL